MNRINLQALAENERDQAVRLLKQMYESAPTADKRGVWDFLEKVDALKPYNTEDSLEDIRY